MRIALLMPVTLSELQPLFKGRKLPAGYPYPLFVPLIYYYIDCGHEVVLCTENFGSPAPRVFYGKRIILFCAGTLPRAKMRAALYFRYEILQMISFLKKHPCDVYHAHWLYDFALAAYGTNKEKTLITIHDWPEEIRKSHNDFYWNRRCGLGEKMLYSDCAFTTVSPYMKRKFMHIRPEKEIEVIPNFTDFCIKKESLKEPRIESPVIISINNGFDRRKNVPNLILAFSIIKKRIPGCILQLIGNEYGKNESAEIWSRKHADIDGIEFIGPLNHAQVISSIQQSDIFVHVSREESFGMVVLEAMSQGIPVVGGKDSGAVPWLLEDGRCGKLVDVEDYCAISDAVVDLLKGSVQWKIYSEAGMRRAGEFTVDIVGRKYLRKYETIVNAGKI